MDARDEIIDAMEGRRGEHAPPAVFTQTGTVSQMEACGAFWPEASFDADRMARLALQPAERFGFGTVKLPFDIVIAPEALGCGIREGAVDSQPAVTGSPWRWDGTGVPDVPDLMSPDEFLASGRCPLILDAASKVASRREDLFLITGMEDPLSTVSQMVGMEALLMGALMEPERCREWVRAVTPCLEAYAGALSEASDDVQMIVEACVDIISPEMFGQLAEDAARKVITSMRDSFSTVHTCGDTSGVREGLASLGETGLSLESFGDYAGVMEDVSGRVRVIGGVPPVDHLMMGTPEDVARDAREASDAGYDIIAPECGVPPRTPDANLAALAGYRSRAS